MYAGFKLVDLQLDDIDLDDKNPRIVSQTPLTTQAAILAYLYENEELEAFRPRMTERGVPVGMPVAELRRILITVNTDFRDKAPVTAAEAEGQSR